MDLSIKILIVDDEVDHILLISRILERDPGLRIEAVNTLKEAKDLVKTFHPDIILSDFKLTDGDARTIIEKYAGSLPVIIMTSYGNETLAVEMIKSGALDYIVKSQENFSNLRWFIERSLREWNNMKERKKAEEELRQKNEQLSKVNDEMIKMVDELKISREKAVESDQLKSAFLANMSHEIRTPMNGILGFANLLSDKDISEEEKNSYVEIINNCGNQLLIILDDLIDIAKIEANQLSIDLQPVSINDLLSDIHLLLSAKVNQETAFAYKPDLENNSDIIITDPVRLKQVLVNLISNAIKFTHKGNITFGYEIKNSSLEFFVRDTGIGITPEQKELIFQRFMQGDVSTSRMFGGTGLGLAISKALVELLGGKIWVESTFGEGSCFYFTVPYHPVFNEGNDPISPEDNKSDHFLRTTGSDSSNPK